MRVRGLILLSGSGTLTDRAPRRARMREGPPKNKKGTGLREGPALHSQENRMLSRPRTSGASRKNRMPL
eukprot:7962503-Heterocapsa_arctica.AAC.1